MSLQLTMKALADPVRRRILELLKGGPRTAGEIQENFEISFAAISRHLSVLREADLVIDRREGKNVYYELNASIFEEILLWIKGFSNDAADSTKGTDAARDPAADSSSIQ